MRATRCVPGSRTAALRCLALHACSLVSCACAAKHDCVQTLLHGMPAACLQPSECGLRLHARVCAVPYASVCAKEGFTRLLLPCRDALYRICVGSMSTWGMLAFPLPHLPVLPTDRWQLCGQPDKYVLRAFSRRWRWVLHRHHVCEWGVGSGPWAVGRGPWAVGRGPWAVG